MSEATDSTHSTPARTPLSVAFIAPHAVPDISSGASLWMHTALRALSQRGVRCSLITTSTFDAVPDEGTADWFRRWLQHGSFRTAGPRFGQGSAPPIQVWESLADGIHSCVLQTTSLRRESLRALDESLFVDLVCRIAEQTKPDIVLSYGGMLLDEVLRRRLRKRGCKVVFFIANGNYRQRQVFDDVDAFISDSQATAQLYLERFGFSVENVGNLVDTQAVTKAPREPTYCTLINPSPQKGVTVLLRLIEMARERAPEIRFLVVESRSSLLAAVKRLNLDQGILDRVETLSAQENLAEVYRKTRVLLMPSLGYESSGRVAIEAIAQGIPVLATRLGGLVEALAICGNLLELPERCHRDPWQMPSTVELEDWWRALHRLWTDTSHYEQCVKNSITAGYTDGLGTKAAYLHNWLLGVVDIGQHQLS